MVMQNSLERNHSYSKIYHFLDLGKDKHQGGNDRKDKPIGNFWRDLALSVFILSKLMI